MLRGEGIRQWHEYQEAGIIRVVLEMVSHCREPRKYSLQGKEEAEDLRGGGETDLCMSLII